MGEREKIEERLRKKQHEVAALEEKLRSSRIYVQALMDIIALLGDEAASPEVAEPVLRAGSAVDEARRVILDRKQPVHVDEILVAMGRQLTRGSKASLTSSLAAYVRKGDIFTRPAPNTFGLIELRHFPIEYLQKEPPTQFGRDMGAIFVDYSSLEGSDDCLESIDR